MKLANDLLNELFPTREQQSKVINAVMSDQLVTALTRCYNASARKPGLDKVAYITEYQWK